MGGDRQGILSISAIFVVLLRGWLQRCGGEAVKLASHGRGTSHGARRDACQNRVLKFRSLFRRISTGNKASAFSEKLKIRGTFRSFPSRRNFAGRKRVFARQKKK